VALEWLLVVAALAGLAALAVVVAQRVVGDTAEQISGSSPRRAAAELAAFESQLRARAAGGGTWAQWEARFTETCVQIAVLYADAGVEMRAAFARPTGHSGADPVRAAALAAASEAGPTATAAQARCAVEGSAGVAAPAGEAEASLNAAGRAADAVAARAAKVRVRDTWATWRRDFTEECNQVLADHGAVFVDLGATLRVDFNAPTDAHHGETVTQSLLDRATTTRPVSGRPQLRCEVVS